MIIDIKKSVDAYGKSEMLYCDTSYVATLPTHQCLILQDVLKRIYQAGEQGAPLMIRRLPQEEHHAIYLECFEHFPKEKEIDT